MKTVIVQLCFFLCTSLCQAEGLNAAKPAVDKPVTVVVGGGNGSMGLPLNTTGISSWGDAGKNGLKVSQPEFPRQDADTVKKFSFTKLDGNGEDLPDSAASWSCVRDNVTGLIWEGKTTDGGLHGNAHTYTWYNSDDDINGGREGSGGSPNDATCGNPITVAAGCDTEKFVGAVNKAGWCGYSDWRLPAVEELSSIVNYGKSMPAIDPAYFPGCCCRQDSGQARPLLLNHPLAGLLFLMMVLSPTA